MAPGTRSRDPGARSSQRRQNRKSYREDSTDSDSDGDFSDDTLEDVEAASSPPLRPRRFGRLGRPPANRQSKSPGKRKSTYTNQPRSRNKIVKTNCTKNSREANEASTAIPSAGRIPPWHTLPYHILLEVFLYASEPFITDSPLPVPSPLWLLRTARVCRSFAEPALSALYYNPPLSSPSRAHGLLSHLQAQDSNSMLQYRSKIRYLDMEVYETLLRKHKGQDPMNLGDLIRLTPQLRGIGIHTRLDFPRCYPSLRKGHSSLYQPSLRTKAAEVVKVTLDTLQEQQIKLHEWKWNGPTVACLGPDRYFAMKAYHETIPLQRLTKLTMVGLDHIKTLEKPEEHLASAVCALTHLQELHLSISALFNANLLPLLPRNLQVLSIADCPVTAKTLNAFLITHGEKLAHLTLDHNKSLNLSFLVGMAQTCPSLKSLTMDLTYHNSHSAFSDSGPQFKLLLMPDEIPTWPRSLQKLELLHLRKWDCGIAENFFSSLIEAAPTLPDLRSLNIKASLSESGWRERVSFRDRWVSTFQKVFLRLAPPPNPHLRSIASFKAYKSSQARTVASKPNRSSTSTRKRTSIRKHLDRVEIPLQKDAEEKTKPASVLADSDSSDEPLIRRRRSSRLKDAGAGSSASNPSPPQRHRRRQKCRRSDSDDELSSEDSALDDDTSFDTDARASPQVDSAQGLFIQGMCDMVRISIDTLRPREEQLDESDFLDEEISGDEDWNGDDDGFDGNDGYAW